TAGQRLVVGPLECHTIAVDLDRKVRAGLARVEADFDAQPLQGRDYSGVRDCGYRGRAVTKADFDLERLSHLDVWRSRLCVHRRISAKYELVGEHGTGHLQPKLRGE